MSYTLARAARRRRRWLSGTFALVHPMAKDLGNCHISVKVLLELLPPQSPPPALGPGSEALWELSAGPHALLSSPPRPTPVGSPAALNGGRPPSPTGLATSPQEPSQQSLLLGPAPSPAAALPHLGDHAAAPLSDAEFFREASALASYGQPEAPELGLYEPLPGPRSSGGSERGSPDRKPDGRQLSPEASQPYPQQLRRQLLPSSPATRSDYSREGGSGESPPPFSTERSLPAFPAQHLEGEDWGSEAPRHGKRLRAAVEHAAPPPQKQQLGGGAAPLPSVSPAAPVSSPSGPSSPPRQSGAVTSAMQAQQQAAGTEAGRFGMMDVRLCIERALHLDISQLPEGAGRASGPPAGGDTARSTQGLRRRCMRPRPELSACDWDDC
jgi:hypothetical protein